MSNMPEIIIDNIRFDSLPAMKYWSFPKTYDTKKKADESKYMCECGQYIGSRKMDGAWNMLIKDNDGNFHLRSRTESVNGGYTDKADWIPHITKELSWIPNGTVLLGEICFPDNEGSRKITSVLNCLKDKCLERQEKSGYLYFYIFDILAYNGKSLINTAFEKRINQYLNYELADLTNNNSYVLVAEYKEGKELWDLVGEILANGGEGIVITKKEAVYQPDKRTARLTLKIKKEVNQTIDAFITGEYKPANKEYEGKEIEKWCFWENDKTGEKYNTCKFIEYTNGEPLTPIKKPYYYGWAGAIEFGLMKDGEIVHLCWLSNITDEMKKSIVENPGKYKNKVYELTAMEVEHIDGEYSLRHGKIVQERTDKTYLDCEFSQIS